MEEEPIRVHLDPSKKDKMDDQTQDNKFVGDSGFRFRDKSDWNSMFTPLERLERQKNTVIF